MSGVHILTLHTAQGLLTAPPAGQSSAAQSPTCPFLFLHFVSFNFVRTGLFPAVRCSSDSFSLVAVTDEDTVKRYYAKFEEKFFQMCEKELAKINTFYSGNIAGSTGFRLTETSYCPVFTVSRSLLPEKLAEAQRRFATLQNELQSSLDAQRESSASGRGLRRRKTVFALSQQERCKHRNIKDLQLAFSEFYLSLILLQNYQVHTNTVDY